MYHTLIFKNVQPNFEYMNSLYGDNETCNGILVRNLFWSAAFTVGIFTLIFLITGVIGCVAVVKGSLGKGGNDDVAETLECWKNRCLEQQKKHRSGLFDRDRTFN